MLESFRMNQILEESRCTFWFFEKKLTNAEKNFQQHVPFGVKFVQKLCKGFCKNLKKP